MADFDLKAAINRRRAAEGRPPLGDETVTEREEREVRKRLRQEKKRADGYLKEALLNSFDKLGNEAFFVRLGKQHPECYAMCLMKLLPLEVKGALDTSLTITVVKQVIGPQSPKDVSPRPGFPVALVPAHVPEDADA